MTALRQLIFVIAAPIFAILFVVGGLFFISDPFELSSGQFYLLGILTVLAGIFAVSYDYPGKWAVGFSLIGIGIYGFLRGSEAIEHSWLTWLIGIAFFTAAGLLCYGIGQEISAARKT